MAPRPCLGCGSLCDATRCERCRTEQVRRRAKRRGTRQFQGYDRDHERLRRQTLKATPYCLACGHTGSKDNPLSVDHVRPLSSGGKTTRSNYQSLCRRCNSAKGARVPQEVGGPARTEGTQEPALGRANAGGEPFAGGKARA
jgi:5-methylcytosine-specific restriction endonuclease McrA